jgi:hypothetical protein
VKFLVVLALVLAAAGRGATPPAWTDVVRIDPAHPHHFIRADGTHLFLFNKTAWHYFSAAKPEITLDRATALGATVIRVQLEGAIYPEMGFDAWPVACSSASTLVLKRVLSVWRVSCASGSTPKSDRSSRSSSRISPTSGTASRLRRAISPERIGG